MRHSSLPALRGRPSMAKPCNRDWTPRMTQQLVIDGELRSGASVLEVDEPALGRPFESVSVAGVDDLNAAVAAAVAAFPAWSSLGPWRRAEHLNAFATKVESAQ